MQASPGGPNISGATQKVSNCFINQHLRHFLMLRLIICQAAFSHLSVEKRESNLRNVQKLSLLWNPWLGGNLDWLNSFRF